MTPGSSEGPSFGSSGSIRRPPSEKRPRRNGYETFPTVQKPIDRRKSDVKHKAQKRPAPPPESDNDDVPSTSSASINPKKKKQKQEPIYDTSTSTIPFTQMASRYDMDADSDTEVADCLPFAYIGDKWRAEYSRGVPIPCETTLPRAEVMDDGFVLKPKDDYRHPEKRIACSDRAEYFDEERFQLLEGEEEDKVHYEVTAHDLKWLERLNKARKQTSGKTYLPTTVFSKIMEILETQTYTAIHKQLLNSLHVCVSSPRDDDECDVCRDVDTDGSEEMIYCDSCNICVHETCGGVRTVPTGGWKCLKCRFSRQGPAPNCIFCPALGGSMTHSADKRLWAHHSCALFVKQIEFEDAEDRAPIKFVEKVEEHQYREKCCVCDTKQGVCVKCSDEECEMTFHVCCALRAGCQVVVKEKLDHSGMDYIHKCHRHSEPENNRRLAIEDEWLEYRNPWLAKLESFFYGFVNYVDVSISTSLPEFMIADVFEYWKQKRLDAGGPLIRNLSDLIPVPTTIEDVAQRAMETQQNRASISIGTIGMTLKPSTSSADASGPSTSTATTSAGFGAGPETSGSGLRGSAEHQENHPFFRPAVLMVNELRHIHLKRAANAMKRDLMLSNMVMRREQLNVKLAEASLETIRIAQRMFEAGEESLEEIQKALDFESMSKHQLKRAAEPERFKAFLERIGGVQKPQKAPRISGDLQNTQKTTQKTSGGIQKVQKSPEKSPLRRQNHNFSPSKSKNSGAPSAHRPTTASGGNSGSTIRPTSSASDAQNRPTSSGTSSIAASPDHPHNTRHKHNRITTPWNYDHNHNNNNNKSMTSSGSHHRRSTSSKNRDFFASPASGPSTSSRLH
ncbi:hypothetical protein B9Z55_008720 [Caenorhabditis nigoni]|uniref:PHD-type domain-containing protein n=1 Tax=Caenorhabditis nigoni TaxID=1611254 RepID=A0A2G5UNS8_9PELO|nr:hypothetical protein B9Z55_008720 [Caenorhabditis nigoni]